MSFCKFLRKSPIDNNVNFCAQSDEWFYEFRVHLVDLKGRMLSLVQAVSCLPLAYSSLQTHCINLTAAVDPVLNATIAGVLLSADPLHQSHRSS